MAEDKQPKTVQVNDLTLTGETQARALPNAAAAVPDTAKANPGFLDSSYSIQTNQPIKELSSKYATAYVARLAKKAAKAPTGEGYALVFDKRFPVRMAAVTALQEIESATLVQVFDHGKVRIGTEEQYAVVLERPAGKPIAQCFTPENHFDETQLRGDFLRPIHSALLEMQDRGIVHGQLNLNTIFYDDKTKRFTIGECISSFCGAQQEPLYETLTRLLTMPDAKGDRDYSADYFALGTLALFVGLGRIPIQAETPEIVTELRMRKGAQECYLEQLESAKHPIVAGPMQQMFRGVLTDSDEERWTAEDFDHWINRREVSILSPSRVHKETTSPFEFDGREYFSRKTLAHAVSLNWSKARTGLQIEELSRWVKLSMKKPKIADRIDALEAQKDALLADDKLAKILHLIDPLGPLRYQQYRVNIWGIGSFLASAYIEGKRDNLQAIANMFTMGLIEQWISNQENLEDYSYSNLLWTPYRVTQHLRRASIGFGIERILYMLNRTLPCQSSILQGYCALTLDDLLLALDTMAPQKQNDSDPIDRHSAAFIAEQIDLADEIRVKGIQSVPGMNNNAHIMMLALLTVAQGSSRLKVLKGISSWLKTRMADVLEHFHNARIKKSFAQALDKAAKTGVLTDLFKTVRDPSYIRRDQQGFREAKKQYKALSQEVAMLSRQANIEKVAYQYGLRLAVMFSYLVVAATMLLIAVRSA